MISRRMLYAAGGFVLVLLGVWLWTSRGAGDPPQGFAKTNGRIEAERIDIATKFAGRLESVLVKEGDVVEAGQVLAKLDTAEIDAQLKEAEAAKRQAEQQLDQSDALVAQRNSELTLAGLQLERSLELVGKGFTPQETVDQRQSAKRTAEAAINAANAQVAVSKAAIEAAEARIHRLKVDIADYTLKAPRSGRIEYRLALPGEVLAAGGRVLTLLDLTDVYMTVFLPTSEAGRLRLGDEARIIFDAAPQYVVPANVTFVASEAQFTPKYVETKIEREKLMFRVKVALPSEILKAHANIVKTGVPGVAYLRLSQDAQWPTHLDVKLPQ
ncbi:HlyD family efflux transporter periplasmic adaptor subunit [uncultured Hyphomicrobium sp.]|jgi:HlyD family secretion protein|uniref:HlyD family secretion protein n=1 Tax=uncultured Hyphomicrobium sp. TaxID=194373 RepID=UPI0025DD4B89|nr:HlyD family efflux transporter periplasmic adaptor subunit [uncultured Hyphomicrobium sp.]